MESKSI